MAVKNQVLPVPLSTVVIAATYAPFVALPQACFMVRIINESNASAVISFDGVTDHDRIGALGVFQLNAQTNSQPNNYIANIAKGTMIYVKGAGAGSVYLSGYYQPIAA